MKSIFLTVLRAAFLMMLTLSLSATPSFAQEITGSIGGTVKDPSGASVPGATVTITDVEKKVVVRTVNTGEDGSFNAPQLPSATYEVSVEASNFKKHIEKDVKLDVNQRRTL